MASEGDANTSSFSKSIRLPDSEELDKSFPLVFTCSKCNAIIGDSHSWVCANDDLQTITLMKVSNKVQQGRQLMSSTEGFDLGSAYYPLKCVSCSSQLGKMYQTTPKHLDDIRELFTVSVDHIDSYQVGSCDQVQAGTDLASSCTAHKYLLSEVRKLQQTVLALHNRLKTIESSNSDTEFVRRPTELDQVADNQRQSPGCQPLHRQMSSSDWEPVLSTSVINRLNTTASGLNDSINSSSVPGNDNIQNRLTVSSKRRNMVSAERVSSPNIGLKRGKFA